MADQSFRTVKTGGMIPGCARPGLAGPGLAGPGRVRRGLSLRGFGCRASCSSSGFAANGTSGGRSAFNDSAHADIDWNRTAGANTTTPDVAAKAVGDRAPVPRKRGTRRRGGRARAGRDTRVRGTQGRASPRAEILAATRNRTAPPKPRPRTGRVRENCLASTRSEWPVTPGSRADCDRPLFYPPPQGVSTKRSAGDTAAPPRRIALPRSIRHAWRRPSRRASTHCLIMSPPTPPPFQHGPDSRQPPPILN